MIDLRPQFKHLHWRVMPHSHGVEVASDWTDKPADDPVYGLYKKCGFWTMREAQILYESAKQIGGLWVDVGCHTGWTAAHLEEAGCLVIGVDPMGEAFGDRFRENTAGAVLYTGTSSKFFAGNRQRFSGVVIDGDHDHPAPLDDACHAADCLEERGVILLHDASGKPVQDAVMELAGRGFRVKVYVTPHVVACCWRGQFIPPEYEPLPQVVAGVRPWLGEIARFA